MPHPITLSVGTRFLQQDRIFSLNPQEMRDRCNACFISLRDAANQAGFALSTEDIHPPDESELVIDLNVQKWETPLRHRPVRYLITLEPPVVFRDNWLPREHLRYDKIFTWNDDLVDNRRYFLLRYAHNLGVEPSLPSFEDRELSATIVGFKSAGHAQEQYSERFATIRWFLNNHPDQFTLYGAGWPKRFRPVGPRLIEQFSPRLLDLLLGPFYPLNRCYAGRVADKVQVFSKYRFAFCYENTGSATGYITEKIFDAFRAGCVPVYLGPPNAHKHIPEDCFLDRRRFSSHQQLYDRLMRLTSAEFLGYQRRIGDYLQSAQARQFTPAHFASVLVDHIVADLALVGAARMSDLKSDAVA